MFGSEQSLVQSRILLRLVYFLLGEIRYPIRLRAAILHKSLPKDFHPRIIWDAGSGDGQTSFWLSNRFAQAQVIGTDIRKEQVERCDHIASTLKRNNLTFLQKNVLDGCSQSVDLLVCSEVLEHIENYDGALKTFSNSMASGGILIIHTPADNYFQSPTWGLRRFIHSKRNGRISFEQGQYHVRAGFNLDKLAREIEENKYQIISKHHTFGPIAMFAHTIYEWTRSRSKIWQIATLWPLITLGYIDILLSFPVGAGVLIVAQKK